MKRLMTLLAVLALLAGACGDSGDDTTTVPPATSSSTTTSAPTTAPPTTGPTTSPPTTLPPTTIGPTTPPTIAPPPVGADYVSVYFSVGGWIGPVARQLETGESPELVAMNHLLNGPTDGEISGVPPMYGGSDGAELLGISIGNGVAVVDISPEFNAPTGTSGETMALASLTFTLTELPTVDDVVLMLDGQRLQYFGGHGWDITPSLDRDTFMVNQGAFGSVLICEPAWWLPVTSPLTIAGYAEGSAGTVQFAIYDNDGLELVSGETVVTPLPVPFSDHGSFSIDVPFTVGSAQLGSVMVWDRSEGSGVRANLVEHAVWLMPDQ